MLSRTSFRILFARACVAISRRLASVSLVVPGRYFAAYAQRLAPGLPEPYVALATFDFKRGYASAAFEHLIGANARHPGSRPIAVMMARTLCELEMCEQAADWLRRAAHSAWSDPAVAADDGHADSLFWRELGLFLLAHADGDPDMLQELQECGVLAELLTGWKAGQPPGDRI